MTIQIKCKSTMVELVAELEKLPPSPGLGEMIAEAKAGEYHDYKNQKYSCGKLAVVTKLLSEASLPITPKPVREKLRALAEQVKSGVYDEEADEDDLEMMRKDTPRHLWAALGLEQTH